MRYYHILLNTFLALIFILLYDGFSTRLLLYSPILIIVFLIVFARWQIALFWTIFLGIFLDGSFILPSGIPLFSFLWIFLIINLMLRHWFPRSSFYSSLILIPVATLLFEGFSTLFGYLLKFAQVTDFSAVPNFYFLFRVTGANILAAIIIFIFLQFSQKHLRRFFLLKSHS